MPFMVFFSFIKQAAQEIAQFVDIPSTSARTARWPPPGMCQCIGNRTLRFTLKKNYDSLADGALDTLGSVIRVLGDESFPLDQDVDLDIFRGTCKQFAGHIENGAAVPARNIPQSADGQREWTQVQRFFAERRRAEKAFVTERLDNYRDIVEDLVIGLRQIGERDQSTESRVRDGLTDLQHAVSLGNIKDIKAALADTVRTVTDVFAEQKREYEEQLGQMNQRLSSLRQDLVAAREEMQRDPLTDAYNRKAFDKAIEQSLNLHYVLNQPVTLVMIDLDKFKGVNDTYGHSAGDAALRAVGECLERSFIRKGDLVARYGGDEFAVILNDTEARQAAGLIERFLDRVGQIEIPGLASDLQVSCSAGFTEVHESDTVASLVQRADKALYEAKSAGRNRAWHTPWSDHAQSR